MLTEDITRPPDGPWKWPDSWEVLRHCPDALDLINGQLREWTNCAGVIADALEEGGYPILARSVRGMQGGYQSEPIEQLEVEGGAEVMAENRIAKRISERKIILHTRDSIESPWKRAVLKTRNRIQLFGKFIGASHFLTWGDDKLRMWSPNERGIWEFVECHNQKSFMFVFDVHKNGKIAGSCMSNGNYSGVFCVAEFNENSWSIKELEWPSKLLPQESIYGEFVLTYDSDSQVRLWESHPSVGWVAKVLDCEWAKSDGLVCCEEGRTFGPGCHYRCWSGGQKWLERSDQEILRPVVFLPDGRMILQGRRVEVWSKSPGCDWSPSEIVTDEMYRLHDLFWMLPDGRLISSSGSILQLIGSCGSAKWSISNLKGHTSDINEIILLSDGSIQSRSDNEVLRWGNDEHL